MCKSSSYNEKDYRTRYEKYIKPVINELIQNEKSVRCSGVYSFTNLNVIEIVNSDALDFNVDGLLVSFTISEDV